MQPSFLDAERTDNKCLPIHVNLLTKILTLHLSTHKFPHLLVEVLEEPLFVKELLVVVLSVAVVVVVVVVEVLGTVPVVVAPFVSFSFETEVVFLLGTAVDLSAAVAAVFSGSVQSIKQNNKRGMCMILTVLALLTQW